MKRRAGLTVLGLSLLTCHQAILTAPDGSTMTVVVNPEFIPANGGVSVVSAHIFEPAGTPVADGTVVQFFTTLGDIDEQGKTNDGVARVNLVSDSRSGTAKITAISGPIVNSDGAVEIGTAQVTLVKVTADPVHITDSRSSHIFANVYDLDGNPVANVPVIFEVVQSGTTSGTESMESGGRPIHTDNNGRAEDVMRTRYPRDAAPKTVTVRATTSNDKFDDVTLVIN